MFFNLWSGKSYILIIIINIIALIVVLFLVSLIFIKFIRKLFFAINKKNKNKEFVLKIDKLDDKNKFDKLCKYLNLKSSYNISDFIGKNIKTLNYKQINNLIIKKLLG